MKWILLIVFVIATVCYHVSQKDEKERYNDENS
jgi:hypothetical protein